MPEKEEGVKMPEKQVKISKRYDPSAVCQLANLPLPDSTEVVLDGVKVGTLADMRKWEKEYNAVIARNPLRKRKSNDKTSKSWLTID